MCTETYQEFIIEKKENQHKRRFIRTYNIKINRYTTVRGKHLVK